MKRERKPLKLTGTYRLDEQGNKVEIVNPKEDAKLVSNCTAFDRTIRTGIQHYSTA